MQSPERRQLARKRLVVSGRVQGVGFRPFVYRHANRYGLSGSVRNTSGKVEISVQGNTDDVNGFINSLVASAPPVSAPLIELVSEVEPGEDTGFLILDSRADPDADIHLPADLFTCEDCLRELQDPEDPRYRYPFINCTQCGPRYTIIDSLPYDRSRTSMADFEMCDDCRAQYENPDDRRYHAEPVACERCGPRLRAVEKELVTTGNEAALEVAARALLDGRIVAIKGIGGYHLACDAGNNEAVSLLRRHKPRPHKPLAVMFDSRMIDDCLDIGAAERELLTSPARPVVVVRAKTSAHARNSLSHLLSPGLGSIGAMLPYSPLHHLLLEAVGRPLVMTSANISGEPVLTENSDISKRLQHVAQVFLHHDRPILRPADDSVYRQVAGEPRPIRLGRGGAPLELRAPFELEQPVIAAGCHMKNTVALAWGDRIVVSPHIGEMDSVRSSEVFERTIEDLQSLYQVEARTVLCDMHPAYGSTRWALQQSLPVHQVYHHHAHASAAWFESAHDDEHNEPMLVFTWDGVGLGPDGQLWGGDALLGGPGGWQRAAHMRPFRLPGGERAGREPWRSAAGLCWEADVACPVAQADSELLQSFWEQRKNSPATTAVGRLFDAAAALTGVCLTASYEGQGPMWLETAAHRDVRPIELPLRNSGDGYIIDWSPLLAMLCNSDISLGQRAGCFHSSLAYSLLQQALRIRIEHGVERVGLSGGVFQNRLLTEQAVGLLQQHGFDVVLPRLLPVNDACISLGQVISYAFHQHEV